MKLPKCRGQKIKVTVEDVDNIATCINQALSGEGEDEVTVEGLGKAVPKNSMAVSNAKKSRYFNNLCHSNFAKFCYSAWENASWKRKDWCVTNFLNLNPTIIILQIVAD